MPPRTLPDRPSRVPAFLQPDPGVRILEPAQAMEGAEAGAYQEMVERCAWAMTRPFLGAVAARYSGLRAPRVLDLGTGPGTIPVALARRFPDWTLLGVDLSLAMLERARELAARSGVAARVRFQQADVTCLPFPAQSFDLVLSHFTLHHLERPELLLDEALRVARPPGRILIRDLLRQAGWRKRVNLLVASRILGYTPRQARQYSQSVDAALTSDELRQLIEARIPGQTRLETEWGGYALIEVGVGAGVGAGERAAPSRGPAVPRA